MKFIRLILITFILPFVLGMSCDTSGGLSNDDVVKGLKEALTIGTDSTTKQLNVADGYLKNELIKILLPKEVQQVESQMRQLGLGSLVDELVVKMNRTAEDAASDAKPIFWNAITGITITDGMNILKGADTSATHYLRTGTSDALFAAYKPKIEASMTEVGVQNNWKSIATPYNQAATLAGWKKVPEDISQYITSEALDGLFVIVGQKERDIRKDPLKRVTEILQKVFGTLDN